jgi:hypothetical protein
MAVRSDKCLAGHGKSFKVYLVTNTVTGAAVSYAVLLCYRLDITVVIGVFKA